MSLGVKRDRKKKETPQDLALYRFYLHKSLIFLGWFWVGFFFSVLVNTSQGAALGLRFPSLLYTEIPNITVPLPPLRAGLLPLLLSSLYRTAPIVIVLLLGLRDYHYFCLAGIWNAIFCASHGMLVHRFSMIVAYAVPQLRESLAARLGACLFGALVLFFLLLVHVRLLHANRIAATGLFVPCLGRGGGVYSHATRPSERETTTSRVYTYFRAMLTEAVLVFLSGVMLLLLCYVYRTVMRI